MAKGHGKNHFNRNNKLISLKNDLSILNQKYDEKEMEAFLNDPIIREALLKSIPDFEKSSSLEQRLFKAKLSTLEDYRIFVRSMKKEGE